MAEHRPPRWEHRLAWGVQEAVPGGHRHAWWHLAHATISLLCQARPGVFPEVALQML